MERREYFYQEIEILEQKKHDARLLFRRKDGLIREAEKIAKRQWEKVERKVMDFV